MTQFKETKGSDTAANNTTAASQLQTLVKMYERIQTYIYRLMATDSIPKFCKTPKVSKVILVNAYRQYIDAMATMFPQGSALDEASDQQLRVGDEGSPTRAYITISQVS